MRVFVRFFCKAGKSSTFNNFPRLQNFLKCTYCNRTPENFFLKAIGKCMLAVNTITCGTLMLVGDLANQEIEFYRLVHCPAGNCRYDWGRAGRMFFVGLMLGPPQHFFYKVLDRRFPQTDMRTIAKKILLDQSFLSPTCIFIFFYGLGMLERNELSKINQEFKQKFWKVYKMDWTVWPGVQVFNFYYISPKYRVIYVNMITMMYDIFLSYIKHEPS